MKSNIQPIVVHVSIENLQQWVSERLWGTNAKEGFEDPKTGDVESFTRNMEILTTLVAVRLSEDKPVTIDTCWVPGLTKRNQSFQIFLARLTRDFKAEKAKVRSGFRHLRAA